MKITKSQLKTIIEEELQSFLGELGASSGAGMNLRAAQLGGTAKRDVEDADGDDDPIEEDGIPFKKLKKGRCTPMGTEECPEGSPQYNLAKAFKGKIRQSNLKRGKNPHGPG